MSNENILEIANEQIRRESIRRSLVDQGVHQSLNNHRGVVMRMLPFDSSGKQIAPDVDGIKRRTLNPGELTWKPASGRLRETDSKSISSNKTLSSKLDKETDVLNSYWGYYGILEPEYDLLEPYTIVDTESYLKQAVLRKHSLMFRNGFEFTGENNPTIKYIKDRTDQIGFMMGTTFENFLKEVLNNLLLCSNCVVIKIRDEECSGGVRNLKNNNKVPVAGYKIVPPQTIFPVMDGKGKILVWRRLFKDGRPWRDYPLDDVIHFFWDRKPGHVFGTPRTVAVRDDIYALRRLEENVELLMITHLFPFWHVAIGTEDRPCQYYPDGTSEIDYIRMLIMNMPKEGVFVSDHRVKVEVKGSEGKGLDPSPILEHFKKRVFTGLGVSPMDMGEADSGNRSTADNVSQNLKDQIKSDLNWFVSQVKMLILKELFQESRTALSVQNAIAEINLEFHEIDTDSQIKMETHASQLYANHGITQTEYRKKLKKKPLEEKENKDTHFEQHVVGLEKVRHRQQKELVKLNHENSLESTKVGAKAQGKGPTKKTTTSKSKSASGGTTHKVVVEEPARGAQASAANQTRPTNQHGKNLDPHKAKSGLDPEEMRSLYDELLLLKNELAASGKPTLTEWKIASESLINAAAEGKDEIFKSRLHTSVYLSNDADMLWTLLQSAA